MQLCAELGRFAAMATSWFVITLLVLLPACNDSNPGGDKNPPNIILITLESLRSDHVGSYGYTRDTTPALDELAEQGTLFENAYSVTSWTLPSHASLFTGLYPPAHQVESYKDRLDDSYTTLAEALADGGYETAGFISGPFLLPSHNLDQGFQTYDISAANLQDESAHDDITNPTMERLLSQFLEKTRSRRPFFLFAYFWDPHYDYIPPSPFDTTFVPDHAQIIDVRAYETSNIVNRSISPGQLDYVISQYDGEILCTDELLGRLWKRLRELDLWENTVIVVTADHGEEFFEHGDKGHKNNLYEESIHVPLIIKQPGQSTSRRDLRLVSLVDVYPTLLELAGIETPVRHHGHSLLDPDPPSRSLFYALRSEWIVRRSDVPENLRTWLETDLKDPNFAVMTDQWFAIRDGRHKLVVTRNADTRNLFDIVADPGEKNPLSTDLNRFTALKDLLSIQRKVFEDDRGLWKQSGKADLTPEQEQHLRSIGYIGR